MNSEKFFLGRPRYWVLAAGVSTILAYLGSIKFHVREFVPFQFCVLALAAIVVVVIITSYKPGEQIIREPLEL